MSSAIVIREYLGNNIEFKMIDGMVYANANSMTDSVTLDNWKRSANTKRYIEALEKIKSVKSTEFIISTEGRSGGTWIHEKLILSLARYISVNFELWADEQITTLIREGSVSLKPIMPQTYIEALEELIKSEKEKERLALENKAKQETIERKTEIIDNMTEDLDSVRLRKVVTDYISKIQSRFGGYAMAYSELYGVFGRVLKIDLNHRFEKCVTEYNLKASENKKYNRENKLKGEDRLVPFKQTNISKVEYICDILGAGGTLIETMAKVFEVEVSDIIDKYNSFKETELLEY